MTECKIDERWPIRTAPLTSQGAERVLQYLLQRLDHVNLSQTENQREIRYGLTKIIYSQIVKLLHALPEVAYLRVP